MSAAPSYVGYDIVTEKKSSKGYANPDRTITVQLDELERASLSERDKHLGRDYFRDIKDFYSLEDERQNYPNFRPLVRVPKLQTLVLNEATDITDSSPKIYISSEGKRDESREKYYQANWRQGSFNNRILESVIWAMLSNMGWLQIGFTPSARRGRGMTWLEARDPETVLPDPYSKSERDWSYVLFYDFLYIDEVRRIWPDKGKFVRPHLYSSADPYGMADAQLDFPEMSPLSQQGDNPQRKIFRSNRVRVRYAYIFDNTRQRVKEELGSEAISANLVHPRFEYMFPDGRWITECEGIVLADGNNWCPQLPDDERGTFPLVRLTALPCISNLWGPPPVKLTRPLQELGERLYGQLFENVIRVNNGVIVIKSNSGLDPNSMAWIPGEVLTINQGSDPPQVISPVPIPQHMVQLPATLFQLQNDLQGFSGARQGEQGQGNTSADLFDATLWQSQYQTRLRGRLLAESLQRLAQIVFYVDARYKAVSDKITYMDKGQLQEAKWEPKDSMDDYDVHLDPGSLRVISAAAMRSVVQGLAKAQMLPTKYVLEALDIPQASELSEEKLREMELSAISRVKRPR